MDSNLPPVTCGSSSQRRPATCGRGATPTLDDSVTGPAEDFCLVVTQRRHVDDTRLAVRGPLAREWMECAQAFAGPATSGPAARRHAHEDHDHRHVRHRRADPRLHPLPRRRRRRVEGGRHGRARRRRPQRSPARDRPRLDRGRARRSPVRRRPDRARQVRRLRRGRADDDGTAGHDPRRPPPVRRRHPRPLRRPRAAGRRRSWRPDRRQRGGPVLGRAAPTPSSRSRWRANRCCSSTPSARRRRT